jgi:hypothetical protein
VTGRARRTWALAALAGLAASPIYWRLVNDDPAAKYLGINDYDIHITSVRSISFVPLRFDVPHFTFHMSSALLARVVGFRLGPVIILALASAATFGLVALLLQQPTREGLRLSAGQAEGATLLWGLLETPTILLMYLGALAPTTRFMTVHNLYSPTWVTALPFSILTMLLVDRLLRRWRGSGRVAPVDAWLVSTALFATSVAKPALALCLLPGLLLYFLVARAPLRVVVPMMVRIGGPTAALVAWQTWFLASGKSQVWVDHFRLDPIGGPVYGWSQARWAFWLPLAWVALAAWATRGRFFLDRLVQLVLCCTVFAVAIFLLFVEAGERAGHGNLGVPLQLCGTFLLLLATRSICASAVEVWRCRSSADFPPWFMAGTLVAMLFVASGLLSYADTLGWVQVPISWFPLF